MDLRIDTRDLARVADVASSPSDANFATLAARGGLDPASDFIGCDFRGWSLADQDLRGFNFTGADLRHTGIERATCDETTILGEARLDRRAEHLRRLGPPKPEIYTMVRIPDLSDAELLERQFVIRDPLSLANIVYAPPPTDQWLTYEGRYDIDEHVVCAFGHRHKKGYVFRDERERRYLVGNSCGAKHLGMGSWKEFSKGRELLEERASYLRDIRDLHGIFARNRDWIASLSANASIRAFDWTASTLQNHHPELVQAVRHTSVAGGRLFVTIRERDFAAEEKLREQQVKKAEKDGSPVNSERTIRTKSVLREAGVLQGRAVFRNNSTIQSQLGHLIRIVDAFLDRKPVMSRLDLVLTTRNARTQVSKLFQIFKSVNDFSSFFTTENLKLFVEWANEGNYDKCRFAFHGKKLTIDGPGALVTSLEPPPVFNFENSSLEDMAKTAASWAKSSTVV